MAGRELLLRAARNGDLATLQAQLSSSQAADRAAALRLASAKGHEEAVELLLEADADVLASDGAGNCPLHSAAQGAHPMTCYQLACAAPAACLQLNSQRQTPIDLSAAAGGLGGEVLNALLLACAGHATAEALAAMRALMAAGAVCDTWAPNGSSALMLAASVDCAEGVALLLGHGASRELQDALGRTALMFAAGNNAVHALALLLDHGASISIRDRRGRNVTDYAAAGSEVQQVLEARIAEMEKKAALLQEELLAELLEGEMEGAPAASVPSGKKAKKKKKGGSSGGSKPAAKPAAAAEAAPAADDDLTAASLEGVKEAVEAEPAAATAAAAAEGAEPSAAPASGSAVEGVAAVQSEAPPSSSAADEEDWQVVGKSSKHHTSSSHRIHEQQRVQHRQQQQQQQQQQQEMLDGSAALRRCPSASSLGSSSSGESHDTAGSSLRSVILVALPTSSRSGSASAARHQAAKAAAVMAPCAHSGAAKPVWDKSAVPPPVAATAKPVRDLQPPQPLQQMLTVNEVTFPPLVLAAPSPQTAPSQPQPQAQLQHPLQTTAAVPSRPDCEASSLQQEGSLSVEQLSTCCTPPASAVGAAQQAAPLTGAAPAAGVPVGLPLSGAGSGSNLAALVSEVATLRAELAHLLLQHQLAEEEHRKELAAVLEDAASHEAAAVEVAVTNERLHCIFRFSAFLQNNNLATELLMSHGLTGSLGDASLPLPALTSCAVIQQQQQRRQSLPLPAAAPVGVNLDFLGFPRTQAQRCFAHNEAPPSASASPPGSLNAAGSPSSCSPPSFSFTGLEQRLRGEFSGDVSHFVAPPAVSQAEVGGASIVDGVLLPPTLF